jgi:L-threonylcarbamoyladenylate synthase
MIEAAARVLRNGGVIVYPTETTYGLGVDPASPNALERVYTVKGRSHDKPLPLIAADEEAVYQAVAEWPAVASRLASRFWPGPLTLILPAASAMLPLLHANTRTVAIRVSSHPVARALSAAVGGLLTATSANRSGEMAPQCSDEVGGELLTLVDGVMDAGRCGGSCAGRSSTIIDVCGPHPRLVRSGCVGWEEVTRALS